MDVYEHNTCSFIVKVWVETNRDLAEPLRWRGHITNVFTGQRQYFKDMVTLVNFVTLYLEKMGTTAIQPDSAAAKPLMNDSETP